MTNVLDSYRDPEPERRRRPVVGGGEKGGQRKRRRPTDWLNDRREGRGERALVPDVEFTSYYGRNVVKPVPWGPQIPTYLFFGGLAGGSQLLATGAYVTGNAPLRRATRLTTAVAAAVSGACLVEDLGRPERFVNMLRVMKLSSPMSVGTWIFSAFSGGAMPLAALEVMRMVPSLNAPKVSGALERALEVAEGPSVALGGLASAPLATYTAVLLSNTALPTWHESRHHLPFVFGGSAAAASGGSAMVLTPVGAARPARTLAVMGAVADLVAMNRLEKHLHEAGVVEPLKSGLAGTLERAALGLNIAGLLGTAVFGRSRVGSVVSGACFVAGSACTRFAVFEAGLASARDPRYTMEPQRRRLDSRGGSANITTGPRPLDDAPRTADGRRPLPGPDGRPSNL